ESQCNELLLAELGARGVVNRIGHVLVLEPRHRFGPRERGALSLSVDDGFAPRGQQMEPLLRLAVRSRFLGMHVETVSAAVDLRRANLDELEQAGLEAGTANDGFETGHGLNYVSIFAWVERQPCRHALLLP